MYAFPITLTLDKEKGGFVVTFKDIPEAITQGETETEALENAQEALEVALDFYFDDKPPVPTPSSPKRRQKTIEFSASLSAKVILLNEMIAQDVRSVELARRLGPYLHRRMH